MLQVPSCQNVHTRSTSHVPAASAGGEYPAQTPIRRHARHCDRFFALLVGLWLGAFAVVCAELVAEWIVAVNGGVR